MSISEQECIESLKEAKEILGHSPTTTEYSELGLSPSRKTIAKYLGSWNEAKAELGMVVDEHIQQKDVDENYFKVIDTSEKAYWLGFLYGDGSVSQKDSGTYTVQIEILTEDVGHIESFKNAVGSEHSITSRDKRTTSRISIANKTFGENVVESGVTDDKAFSNTLPSINEEHLRRGFIRGLADADGTYSKREFMIAGSNEDRFENLLSWIPYDGYVYDRPNENGYMLKINGIETVKDLYSWLFPEDVETEPALERKLTTLPHVTG